MTTCQHKITAALFVFDSSLSDELPTVTFHVHFLLYNNLWKVQVRAFRDGSRTGWISDYTTSNEPDLSTARLFLTMHLEEQQSPSEGA